MRFFAVKITEDNVTHMYVIMCTRLKKKVTIDLLNIIGYLNLGSLMPL